MNARIRAHGLGTTSWSLLAIAGLAIGCDGAGGRPEGRPEGLLEVLPEEAAQRGLDYVNRSGGPAKPTVLEANGPGAALFDLDGDDDLDVAFSQGLATFEELVTGPGADIELFRNDGAGGFERAAGPGLAGWWTGLAAGDVDGDGDTDLVVGGFGDVAVLLQQEDGRLQRLSGSGAEPGPAERWIVGAPLDGRDEEGRSAPAWTTSLALFDADGDGVLDLYVGRYLELDPRDPPLGALGSDALALPCRWKGHDVFCGPRGLVAQGDRVLRGLGDGRFVDVTASWLPGHTPGYTLGVRPFDADGDGDTDLFVANDSAPNLLYENRVASEGRFVERAFAAGVALSSEGRPEAGMGLDVGDVDRDGTLDLVVTNFSEEPTALYLAQRGTWRYTNATFRYGLYGETRRLLSWGVHLTDLDGDGWLELFTANGHVYPQADRPGTGTSYGQQDTLWRLGPMPRAAPVPPVGARSILTPLSDTRGSAVGDVDGDGAPDLVLARIDGPAALGMNRFGGGNKRLLVRCLGPAQATGEGRRTPRDGMGATVRLTVGGGPATSGGGSATANRRSVTLLREVQTAAGFQSASSPWLHFGLGTSAVYDGLVVRWPSGREERLPGGAAGRRLWIREGEGVVREEELP